MCLIFPYRVISRNKKGIKLDFFGKQYTAKDSLINIKPGDFVLVQKDTIIKKISKKQAEEILKLLKIDFS